MTPEVTSPHRRGQRSAIAPATGWTGSPQRGCCSGPGTGDERSLLEDYLDAHRQTLLMKCAGLTAEQLAVRVVPPSSMSLLAARSLDDTFEHEWGRSGPLSVRWLYLHLIEEYERHNGHADLLRERIDGSVGE